MIAASASVPRWPAALPAASLAFLLAACDPSPETEQSEESASVTEDTAGESETVEDPYRWLETVEGERALDWARARNAEAMDRLAGDPRFAEIRAFAEEVYTAEDRIPYGTIRGEHVYNFWQDDTHVRGLWRRTTLESYAADSPDWETLLDLDALAEEEDENWVWKGASCLPPAHERCLLRLSRGGADAVVVREFDVAAKAFLEDGFRLAEAKQWTTWADEATLMVATPHAGGLKNSSGYPRTIRLWRRGTELTAAETVFTGEETDAFAFPLSITRPEGRELFVVRAPDFFTETIFRLGEDGALAELPLPPDVDMQGMIDGHVIARLRSAWTVGERTLPAGAVVSAPLAELAAGDPAGAEILVAPDERTAVQQLAVARDAVYVAVLENVKGRLKRATRTGGGWQVADVAVPRTGTVSITSADAYNTAVLVNFEQFLVPDSLYLVEDAERVRVTKRNPPRFDAAPYSVQQHFAESEDGTRVPYFLIRRADMAFDGTAPTILYGYGGFEIALTPGYLSSLAISWLERGGAYAVANIRGGGEFGPAWHEAALKENRPRAFADFAAVASDLVKRKVTSPDRLGVYGGSNGGLLVTATMVRYPERLGAVVAAVPLIDMLRYHKLLAGASWMAEFGDPDTPDQRAYIAAYSPYQNVRPDVAYPPIFLTTSTRDDRVHPGHARKMAAKMAAQDHEVVYYENIEGGHAAAANLEQRARRDALVAAFFLQELADKPVRAEGGGTGQSAPAPSDSQRR